MSKIFEVQFIKNDANGQLIGADGLTVVWYTYDVNDNLISNGAANSAALARGYYKYIDPNDAAVKAVAVTADADVTQREIWCTSPTEEKITAIKAKTDNLPADPASETNVDTIPTNPLLDNDPVLGNLDASVSSRASSVELEAVDDKIDLLAADAGDGDTAVNHNTGGADALSYKTAEDTGIDNANVRAYLKTDYDAGNLILRGKTITNANGQWVQPLYLNSGLTYYIIFEKPGEYGPDLEEVTV